MHHAGEAVESREMVFLVSGRCAGGLGGGWWEKYTLERIDASCTLLLPIGFLSCFYTSSSPSCSALFPFIHLAPY